jgi:D-alanine--poly(phosphoribitol) ligase subunit 1
VGQSQKKPNWGAGINRLNFCPLDIENPINRVLDVARQLPEALIVCDDDGILARLRRHSDECLKMQLHQDYPPVAYQGNELRTNEASYYIATSGSTGVPKLVKVPHDHTLPFVEWAVPFYRVDVGCRWAQFSSIGFDLSLVDFLIIACGTGTLISLSSQIDKLRPAKSIQKSRITHWHSVPSMIPYILKDDKDGHAASTCRLFTFCGEPLMRADAERIALRYPTARIVNTYGPTEGTLFCSFFEFETSGIAPADGSVPIGQPIPSWNFVLLPDGDTSRLIILSDYISEGYVGVKSPLFSTVGLFGRRIRAFDTGDYFRVIGSELYFSHRRDGMIKVNGNRIDLGEIESVAKRFDLVNPVAFVVEGSIALVVEGKEGSTEEVMSNLAKHLPRHSLPTWIRYVPAHPRTVNGKLDRRAIQDLFGDSNGRHSEPA